MARRSAPAPALLLYVMCLDEIAEVPEDSQVTLLRVLQEGEVRPIGASNAAKVDIRVVAATHQDIPTRRVDRRLRQDLYARLAGFEMALPALRDRLEDLGTLIAAILPRVTPVPERITLDRRLCFAMPGPSTSAISSKRCVSLSPSPTPARSSSSTSPKRSAPTPRPTPRRL